MSFKYYSILFGAGTLVLGVRAQILGDGKEQKAEGKCWTHAEKVDGERKWGSTHNDSQLLQYLRNKKFNLAKVLKTIAAELAMVCWDVGMLGYWISHRPRAAALSHLAPTPNRTLEILEARTSIPVPWP